MNLKEYFEMGREAERQYRKKQQARHTVKKIKPTGFAGMVMSVGRVYETASPVLKPLVKLGRIVAKAISNLIHGIIIPVSVVVLTDVRMIVAKIQVVNPKWEQYQRFLELSRVKK